MTTSSPLCNVKIGNATYYANQKDKQLIESGMLSYVFLSLFGFCCILGGSKILLEEDKNIMLIGFFLIMFGITLLIFGIITVTRYYQTVQRVKTQNKDCRLS